MALLRRVLPPYSRSRRSHTRGEDGAAVTVSPELMARIRRIEIRTKRLAGTMLAGDYRSIFHGTGIEFAEAREYLPGDDVRRIDWNVTARMGVPWVKEFVEERELAVVCAVDISRSALVARPESGRLGAAAELVALLGFAAALNHDRAGLLTFGGAIERFVPPLKGPRHVLRIVREVLQHDEPRPGSDIAAATDYLTRVLPRRSAVFVLSDWFSEDYVESLRALSRRHEVAAIVLVDPVDLALPEMGIVEMEDAETGRRVLLDSGDERTRERYARAAALRAERRHAMLAAAGVDEIEVRLDRDIVDPIAEYFRLKARRR
jgi:uncharacterized protein (DUF58 family)